MCGAGLFFCSTYVYFNDDLYPLWAYILSLVPALNCKEKVWRPLALLCRWSFIPGVPTTLWNSLSSCVVMCMKRDTEAKSSVAVYKKFAFHNRNMIVECYDAWVCMQRKVVHIAISRNRKRQTRRQPPIFAVIFDGSHVFFQCYRSPKPP